MDRPLVDSDEWMSDEDTEPRTRRRWPIVVVSLIIVIVATDAPLLAHQLKRLARRVTLGLGRNGSISGNGSGDNLF